MQPAGVPPRSSARVSADTPHPGAIKTPLWSQLPEVGDGKHPRREVGGQGEAREGRKKGGCRGVEWVAWFQFGILPGSTRRRQSTSRSQRGSKLRGGPAAGVSDSPLDCHPPRVPGDGASWATIQTRGWWRGWGWRGRGASEFPGAWAGQGRGAAQRRAERQRGGSPAPRARRKGLRPPPAPLGSGGSSRRRRTAGRGRGTGRRTPRPPGRRGRRRAAGNP